MTIITVLAMLTGTSTVVMGRGGAAATPIASAAPAPGTVVNVSALPSHLWLPGTGSARRITYWSSGPDGKSALSTGAYFLPKGTPPASGWPVIGWAHGTSGVGDSCAPSRIGPAEPQRDRAYLGRWLSHGYAVTASDYIGLGTPRTHAYLDVAVEAHSVIDMVKASRASAPSLSNRWVTIGQSQGGAAAVATARSATTLGGPGMHYLGGVATGVPAGVEHVFTLLGPQMPDVKVPGHTIGYVLWFLAGFRAVHPEVDLDHYLSAYGRTKVALAENVCGLDGIAKVKNVSIPRLFTRPLNQIPDFLTLLRTYMGLLTTGYDRPLFIGQGLLDTDVPAPGVTAFAAQLTANRQPVTFKLYPTDHSGAALLQSQTDTEPFVAHLFAGR